MTPKEFKKRWESDRFGGGITFNDIAHCAFEWGLYSRPKTEPMDEVRFKVLRHANTKDAEDYRPGDDDSEG